MAEVMRFEDFKSEGSENAVKVGGRGCADGARRLTRTLTGTQAAGKYRQQGRNYVVEDGDIILFKFNAGAGLAGNKAGDKKK